ncbi:putative metabolite transport protein HI_1104 [Daphnia carinata]|uniref:putative metabolite transport protein HI_1104 n=1 Tax=Daphnia carinata TaxID=120202 RepID=UPI00257C7700|nr:putative metabolite transport protein HI_1104 [Daphnia carinata]
MEEECMVDGSGVKAIVPTPEKAASDFSIVKRSKAWYMVALMSLCYGIGELSHFLVGTTSRAMSQDLEYGDQSCLRNSSVPEQFGDGNTTCSEYLEQQTCDNVLTNLTNGSSFCQWDYNGMGIEYQILAGPSFILAFSIGGLLIGALADRYNRVVILATSTIVFSACTVVMGTAQEVWHLIFLRFGVAFGESACQPVSASLVMSLFPQSLHGAALGLVNWGIYFGYGLSYVVGNYIPPLDILGQGWRWAYYLSGIPGFFFAALLLLTTSDPRSIAASKKDDSLPLEAERSSKKDPEIESKSICNTAWINLSYFLHPFVILLCLGACFRHTAGFSWAYNSQLYFDYYYPGTDVGMWLFSVSIVGGSCGILIGGAVSDRIVKRTGLHARAWVLAASQTIASPFAAGVLLLPPPYCFASLLIAYLFAEMWFGVLFAILIELVPASACSFVIAVFLFVMNNVGGNVPVIITPISKTMGYRETLLLFYPGFFLISAVLFGIMGIALQKSNIGRKNSQSVDQKCES